MLIGIGKRLDKLNIGTVSWIIYIVDTTLAGSSTASGSENHYFPAGTMGIAMRYIFRIIQLSRGW